jgi:REP element-mobilizing transposase RayT
MKLTTSWEERENFGLKIISIRYSRNEKHFYGIVRHIENNPVKAGLCSKATDWPYSSGWFKKNRQ